MENYAPQLQVPCMAHFWFACIHSKQCDRNTPARFSVKSISPLEAEAAKEPEKEEDDPFADMANLLDGGSGFDSEPEDPDLDSDASDTS